MKGIIKHISVKSNQSGKGGNGKCVLYVLDDSRYFANGMNADEVNDFGVSEYSSKVTFNSIELAIKYCKNNNIEYSIFGKFAPKTLNTDHSTYTQNYESGRKTPWTH